MTQRVVILLAITFAALTFLPACAFTVKAQAVATSRVVIPCEEETTPGRPTLKLRGVTTQETAAANATDANTKAEKCKRENPESVAADQPVTLNFEGLISTDEAELRKYIKVHRADRNREFTGSYVESTSRLIKEFLLSGGFRHAKVEGRLDQDSGNPRAATFIVHEGLRISIAEYRFQGNNVFSTAELGQNLRECMTRYKRDYYDQDVLEYCRLRLRNFAQSRGYLKAAFGEPSLEESSASVVVTIPVNEGVLYRFGEIKIDGSSLFSPEKLRAMSPLRKGEVADGEKLSTWLYEDLKKIYGENGYIQYTAEVEPEFMLPKGKSEGIVDLKISIDEGQVFKVRKIKFVGQGLPDNLESIMLIHDGDLYNQSLYEKSIDALNNLGWFEFIDKDKVDFKSDEEGGLVDISIKLTRKAQ